MRCEVSKLVRNPLQVRRTELRADDRKIAQITAMQWGVARAHPRHFHQLSDRQTAADVLGVLTKRGEWRLPD
jgi:hypothetical protein